MADIDIRRGDVVRVDLNPTRGGEQQGESRPCIVIQNDIGNQNADTTIIVPLTDAKDIPPFPFHAHVAKGDGGLTKKSIALCEQIRVITKSRINKRIGTLSDEAISDLNDAIRNSLEL